MKINLEIVSSAYLYGKETIENLDTKELVPQMLIRRRLTRGAKILVKLVDMVKFDKGRIVCGSAYGELEATENILGAIRANIPISPTDFQNSVYNTAVSYLSILSKNHYEITTISSGDNTSKNVLQTGAIKALDGDEILLLCFEALNIKNIKDINNCVQFLESGVALKVRKTDKKANIHMQNSSLQGIAKSLSLALHVAQTAKTLPCGVVEVTV